ncbi:MAG: DedA family protein [Parcubacteria group bacterium Gr01-1014_33]|nr:MAG: DedA family protein [Parcubacteria group bacterium Gr01-1014_33]
MEQLYNFLLLYHLLAFVLFPLDSIAAIYGVLFLFLAGSGAGLPVPEEVTLFVGGYLAHTGATHLFSTIYVSTLGLLAADVIGYHIGKYAGDWVYHTVLKHSPYLVSLIAKAQKQFEKHGEKMVIYTRPLMGIRGAVPIFAGHFGLNFKRFMMYDILVSVPWAILLISISYYLGTGIDLITETREIKHIMYAVIALALISYSGIQFIKKQRAKIANGNGNG